MVRVDNDRRRRSSTWVVSTLLVASLATTAWLRGEPVEEKATPTGMVWIPSGLAVLGSAHHYPEERPVVERWVEGFWIDRFEVTNARFAAFVEATGYLTEAEQSRDGLPAGSAVFVPPAEGGSGWSFVAGADWRHPEGPESTIAGLADHPVVQVSLADARAFADWVGRDLPTEAQWEFAARLDGNSSKSSAEVDQPPSRTSANTWQGFFPLENQALDGFVGRAPVGSFQPDERGLFDMIGNVWEWTRSPYRPTHHGTSPATEAETVEEAAVIKGGSYLCSPVACRRYRAAARHSQDVHMATNHLGFRTVLRVGHGGDETR